MKMPLCSTCQHPEKSHNVQGLGTKYCDKCDCNALTVMSQVEDHEVHSDPVNHPSHYTSGGIEVIAAIEAWQLGFCLGNAVKYISRAGKKDPSKHLEDLQKARFYLDREISNLEAKS